MSFINTNDSNKKLKIMMHRLENDLYMHNEYKFHVGDEFYFGTWHKDHFIPEKRYGLDIELELGPRLLLGERWGILRVQRGNQVSRFVFKAQEIDNDPASSTFDER